MALAKAGLLLLRSLVAQGFVVGFHSQTGLPRTRTGGFRGKNAQNPSAAFQVCDTFDSAPPAPNAAHATPGALSPRHRQSAPLGATGRHRSTKWAAGLVRPSLAPRPPETPPGSPGPRLPAVPGLRHRSAPQPNAHRHPTRRRRRRRRTPRPTSTGRRTRATLRRTRRVQNRARRGAHRARRSTLAGGPASLNSRSRVAACEVATRAAARSSARLCEGARAVVRA